MQAVSLSRREFQEFRDLQVARRWDWPAIFSTNSRGNIWPSVTNGYHYEYLRVDVSGVSPLLDKIASAHTVERIEGGRFFIDDRGAFYKDPDGLESQFIQFKFID